MLKSNFSIGQKVRCIGMNSEYQVKLTVGDIYTISRIDANRTENGPDSQLIFVKGNESAWFDSSYFELVSEEAEIEDSFKNTKIKWTKELLQKEALKYKTKTEFSRYNNSAYSAALRMKILQEITIHMPQRRYDKKELKEDGKRLFVKYSNRKLYDTETSKYVTLSEILALPLGSFKVLDKKTNSDITNLTLIQGLTFTLQEKPEKFEELKTVLVEKNILKGDSNA